MPGLDIVGGEGMGRVLLPHMMDESAATAFPFRQDDLHSKPGEQPNGGVVDRGLEHGLSAAIEQGDRQAHGGKARIRWDRIW